MVAATERIGIDPWVAIVLAISLVLLNGFFVAAEFALVKVRPTQIEPHVERGEKRGRLAKNMIEHLDAYLSATQLGITLASLALGWIGEPAFARLLRPLLEGLGVSSPTVVHTVSLTVAFSFIAVFHIVVGELAPKSVAISRPRATSLWVAGPLYLFYKASYPAIWLLNGTARALLKLVGIETAEGAVPTHSEEEVRLLLASRRDSELSDDKRELLENVFELSERNARQIMLPRNEVVFLTNDQSLEENLHTARTSGHTRYPLCEGDLDHIVGIVHIKDLFRRASMPQSLSELARSIHFVPETTPADKLLRRMRAEKIHMAAVLDEFGGTSGVVTLENVIEEIVGEIQDEFDAETPELVKLGPRLYEVAGSMLIAELEDELDLELSDRDEDTIAGVLLSEIGRRARVGDKVTIAGIDLTVKAVDGNRIATIELKTPPPAEQPSEATTD